MRRRRGAWDTAVAAQARLLAVQHHLPIGLVELSRGGDWISVNPAFSRMVGYDPSQLGGLRFQDLIAPADRNIGLEALRRPRTARDDAGSIVVRLLRRDSSLIETELTIAEVRASDSGAASLVVLVQQTADSRVREVQRELEARVEARTAQLAQSNAELEAFSYSVSHDLRAPLRALDGFAQALAEDYGDRLDEIGSHYLQRIRAASQRMALLLDELMKLSRAQRADLRHGPVDLGAIAKDILGGLREQDPERDADTRVEDDLVACGDAILLRIVLDNLIGNAWKFSARTPRARIVFGRTGTPRGEAFFVADNGAGFDPQFADRLFMPFQRLHSASEFEGTGIGLATVQRIVRRHGGEVWAEGQPGKGAAFYFRLPVHNEQDG